MALTLLSTLDTFIKEDIVGLKQFWERRKQDGDITVSRYHVYDDFGDRLPSPKTGPTTNKKPHHRQLPVASEENGGDETFYLRIKLMIAQDQVEQLLLENKQQRDDSKTDTDELRSTIQINEDRHNRWNSSQSERLRKKDEELKKYRLRLREVLALLRTRRNNSRMYLDSMIEFKDQLKELKDDNDALKEENRTLNEEIDEMRRQMTKKYQPKWPWRRLFSRYDNRQPQDQQQSTPFHASLSESAVTDTSLMADFQSLLLSVDQEMDPSPIEPASSGLVGAEGDHEWSAEEAEARERLFARQSSSEPDLGNRASSAALPAPSPSCQFTNEDIPSDEFEDLELPEQILFGSSPGSPP